MTTKSKEPKPMQSDLSPLLNMMKVRLTYLAPLIGGQPSNPEIMRDHLGENAPDAATLEEQVEALGVDAMLEKGTTIFPKVDGVPGKWGYQLKGLLKSTATAARRCKGSVSGKMTAHKTIIGTTVTITPNFIPLVVPEGEEITTLQRTACNHPELVDGHLSRSLRAETAQGPRVALANSEALPVGTTCEFTIHYPVLAKGVSMRKCIEEWLSLGMVHGDGQWRSGGWGKFTWEEILPTTDS